MSDDYGPVERRRQKQREQYWRKPEVGRAWKRVAYAKAAGRIVPPPACTGCGAESRRLEAHHPDYERPLDVRYVCPTCHRDLHNDRRRLLSPVAVRLRRQGWSRRAIAGVLGVCHDTVKRWVNREGIQ